jgi:hypothetical protein
MSLHQSVMPRDSCAAGTGCERRFCSVYKSFGSVGRGGVRTKVSERVAASDRNLFAMGQQTGRYALAIRNELAADRKRILHAGSIIRPRGRRRKKH